MQLNFTVYMQQPRGNSFWGGGGGLNSKNTTKQREFVNFHAPKMQRFQKRGGAEKGIPLVTP